MSKHSEQVNKEAADWFTLIDSGTATALQHGQLEQWMAASDEHQDAYRQLTVIWADLAELSTTAKGATLRQSVEMGVLGRFFFGESTFGLAPQFALALTAVAVLGGALYLSQPAPAPVEVYATHIGAIKTISLDDGSQVTLGANSTINTWSNEDERHVVLKRGQAFFVVSQDRERPFWVDAEDTRVKVVGTQFDVRSAQGRVRVAVLEGVVNVFSTDKDAARESAPPVVLTAGEQVIKPMGTEFQPVKPISELELGAWRQGRLVYRNASLVDVIGDANRYFNGTIFLPAGKLADVPVTLVLRTDQVENLPDMLAEILPIAVHKSSGNRIVISPRIEQ